MRGRRGDEERGEEEQRSRTREDTEDGGGARGALSSGLMGDCGLGCSLSLIIPPRPLRRPTSMRRVSERHPRRSQISELTL